MNAIPILPCLVLVGCVSVPDVSGHECQQCQHAPDERLQSLSLFVGHRSLDEQDYDPVDGQPTLGLEYANMSREKGVGLEFALFASRDEDDAAGIEYEGSTREASFGMRGSFGTGKAKPFIGVGLAFVDASIDPSGSPSDRDGSFAGYFHFGFDVPVASQFLVGLDVRVLHGSELRIAGLETDVDYAQVALRLVYGI